MPAQFLQYRPPEAAPRELTLEEGNGYVRVIFPVFDELLSILVWVYAAVTLIFSAVFIAIAVKFSRQPVIGSPALDALMQHEQRRVLLGVALYPLIFLALTVYGWRMYRRFGWVPRVLMATPQGLSFSRLGWWRMRERRWPASEITSIELQPLCGNLNPRRPVSMLYIHRRKG